MPPVVAGITAAFVGMGATAVTAGAIATHIVSFGINMAINYGIAAITKSRAGSVKPPGILTTFRSPTAAHWLVYGRRRIGGVMLYAQTNGTDNTYMHTVVALAGHECDAVEKVWFNDTLVWDDGVYQDEWEDFAEINVHLGADNQAADSKLVNRVNNWGSEHQLRGITYLYVRLTYSRKAFPQGVPNITALVRGKKVYDPRDGSTTWSQNPALCLVDYLRDDVHGLGAGWDDIDRLTVIDAANICDEDVDGQERYHINAVIDTERDVADIDKAMVETMMGGISDSGGDFKIWAGAYRVPTGPVLTVADFVGPIQIQTERGRRNNFNAVKGVFVSPSDRYTEADYPPVRNATFEADDGEVIYFDFPQPFETNETRAQRNAKVLLARSRMKMTCTVHCKMTAVVFTPGDTVQLTVDRYGWVEKEFEVLKTRLTLVGGMSIELSLQETDAAIYDWADGDAAEFEPAPETTLPNPFDVAAPQFAVTDTVRGNPVRNVLTVTCEAHPSAFFDRFEVQIQEAGDTIWYHLGQGIGPVFEWQGATTGTEYNIQVFAIMDSGIVSDPTQLSHTALGALSAPTDVTNLRLAFIGSAAVLSWDAVTDADLFAYEVRWSAATSGATWAGSFLLGQFQGTQAVVAAQAGTYLVRAVDTGGRYSANAATFSSTYANIDEVNIVATETDSPTFPGTKTGVAVTASELRLSGGLTGTYEFDNVIDLGDVFTARVSAALEYYRYDTTATWDAQTTNIDTWAFNIDSIGVGNDDVSDTSVTIQVSVTDDDPTGSPTWGPWQELTVGDYQGWGFRFRVLLASETLAVTPSITDLAVTVDMPDRLYTIKDRTSGAGADSVTFSPAFHAAPVISILPKNMATGDYVVVGTAAATGVTVTFKNSGGTNVSRVYDLIAKGYGRAG